MYVLVDMEWIMNYQGKHWPTQLSATRVNSVWQTVDSFSTLIRPKDATFQHWSHMAFSGWKPNDFMSAPALYPAIDAFEHWLQPDDILCWWHQEANDLFNMFQKVAQVPDRIFRALYLNEYVYSFLSGQDNAVGSPYKICAARGISTPSPAHCSDNDILAIQRLLQGIDFSQEELRSSPVKHKNLTTAIKGTAVFSLLFDPATKLLHHSDCALLPENQYLPAFQSYKTPLRRKYKPCSCCRDEFLDELWARNQDTIARSDYNYVYSKQSHVYDHSFPLRSKAQNDMKSS